MSSLGDNGLTNFNNSPASPFTRPNSDETLGWQFIFESIESGTSRQISLTTQLAPSATSAVSTPEPNMTSMLALLGLPFLGKLTRKLRNP